jgi:predicted RNA binding protein YcfA (HicA-like mRNA interferase family)
MGVASDHVLRRVLSGTADAAIRFEELCHLLESLGFEKRVKGSHHVFRKDGVSAKVNIQKAGAQAKPYQVKQVRAMILEAKLGGE